jgi:cbb3-type cytochrome oxidase subunit 3
MQAARFDMALGSGGPSFCFFFFFFVFFFITHLHAFGPLRGGQNSYARRKLLLESTEEV